MLESLGKWSSGLSLLITILQIVLAWALWSLRKQFVSKEHCDECTKELEKKQAALEAAQEAMPDADDIDSIKDRLSGIEGDMKGLLATFKGQAEIMKRIERPLNLLVEHHMRKEK